MASKTSRKAQSADVRSPNTTQLRERMRSGKTPSKSPAQEPAAAPLDTDDEAAGRAAQHRAIEQAMARQNVRLSRSPGAIGPIGRTVLLIALMTLVGLITVWLFLAL